MNLEYKTEKYNELLDEFITNLDKEEYYDAHESLEEIWFPRRFEDCDEVRLLKGLINASVSFELVKKGRIESSKKVWKNYLKYKPLIENIESEYIQRYREIIIHVEKIKLKLDVNIIDI